MALLVPGEDIEIVEPFSRNKISKEGLFDLWTSTKQQLKNLQFLEIYHQKLTVLKRVMRKEIGDQLTEMLFDQMEYELSK